MHPQTAFQALLLCAALQVSVSALAATDGFNNVQCGADVAKALIGKTLPNGSVSGIEAQHKAIGLKDLGASEVSDRLDLISWQICGTEYLVLQDKHDKVRDAMPAPAHSKVKPQFVGSCKLQGKAQSGVVVAVLDNAKGGDELPATLAWKIDEAKATFIKISEAGLVCPRSGIATVDGGP